MTAATATGREGSSLQRPSLQRIGGVAALAQAGTFVFGMVLYLTVIAAGDYGSLDVDPLEHVAFLTDHQTALHVWYAVIFLAFGTFLVVHALAVHDRLKARASGLSGIATTFGLLWAALMFAVGMTAIVGGDMVVAVSATDPGQAASLWLTLNLLINGMGGGIELLGGLWLGLVSLVALRAGQFPRALHALGLTAAAAGVLTTGLAGTDVLGSVFGLGAIAWYVWIGVLMLRRVPS